MAASYAHEHLVDVAEDASVLGRQATEERGLLLSVAIAGKVHRRARIARDILRLMGRTWLSVAPLAVAAGMACGDEGVGGGGGGGRGGAVFEGGGSVPLPPAPSCK